MTFTKLGKIYIINKIKLDLIFLKRCNFCSLLEVYKHEGEFRHVMGKRRTHSSSEQLWTTFFLNLK
jgi:hypothetical protein